MVCRQAEKGKQAVKEVIKASGDSCLVPACFAEHVLSVVNTGELVLLLTHLLKAKL